MSSRVVRWCRVWLLGALVSIGACSGTSVAYNRLDFLLPWYVDDYVQLNQTQKIYLDDLLAPFLAWHRTEELPHYLKILQGIEDSLDQPQTPAGVATVFGEFEQAWLRLEGKALTWLLDLGTRLSDAQIASFLEEMWERQHEYEEEYLQRSDQEFYDDSYDDLLDSFEDYLGSMSVQQREVLRDASRRLLRSDRAWLQERAQWLTQLADLLRRESLWQQRVKDAVVARRENMAPEYRRIYEHNMGVIYALIVTLLNERSAQQDRHLREELAELRGDLKDLIEQSKAPEPIAGRISLESPPQTPQ